jgi:hypothetical protein
VFDVNITELAFFFLHSRILINNGKYIGGCSLFSTLAHNVDPPRRPFGVRLGAINSLIFLLLLLPLILLLLPLLLLPLLL